VAGALLVAAGGSGDAITAAALAPWLRVGDPAWVLTYSWDRLLVDPLPGPRRPHEFSGLRHLATDVVQVTASTQPLPPAGSSLPRLAAELPASLLLLDPTDGARGMARQVCAAAEHAGAERVVVVDVGGDALTTGSDAGLRSPLADQLVLAACLRAGLPTQLLVAGAGVDGEIDAKILRSRLDGYRAVLLTSLTAAHMAAVRRVFDWHPSEASGLLAAAAAGHRGLVEVRDAGDLVPLRDDTCDVFSVDLWAAAADLPAAELTGTRSLAEAADVVLARTGVSELRYEAVKATRPRPAETRLPAVDDLPRVDDAARAAAERGADFISLRRLTELLGGTTMQAFEALTALLATHRTERYAPSIYRVHGAAATRSTAASPALRSAVP
jgi:hypothetical protein